MKIFQALVTRIDRIGEWLVNASNDAVRWRRFRRRTIVTLIVLGAFLTYHTVIVFSPKFLISSMYHGRGRGIPQMEAMDEEKKKKLLGRMIGLYEAYHGDMPLKYEGTKFHTISR